ncbi:hypothetical protein [Nocardia fluminea]|uniref:Uncharacterized protein n=1 Tax=Nocardia fluminea TaxID=134984 RepID=A0A2N3VH27_9NOCA|nr:hypothetical protein [Nocardia fluminea]PKV80927.1 hypothetical protein ATK86_5364 [Nocardia fluminea]
MATAILHRDNVLGHAGPARVWHLDPPALIGGERHPYVCIWIVPSAGHQDAEVVAVASTESGAAAGRSVQRRPGSYTLHGDPDSPEYVDGCHLVALQILGGYTVEAPRPQDES